MRKSLILLLSVVFCLIQYSVSAQNDTIWYDKEWNETSKFHAEFFRPKPKKVNGKHIIKDYYINGILQMEGASIAQDTTIFDGEVKHFYKSGKIESKTNFKNGKFHGTATEFFEDGQMRRVQSFQNGQLQGEYKEFYSNGELRGRIAFKNGAMDGLYQEFYDNGKQKTIQTFSEGEKNGDYLEYYSNGDLRYSGHFEDGILQGEAKMYNSEGKLINSGSFLNNKKHGVWTTVGYDNTIVSRTYDNEILDGEMTFEMKRSEASKEEYYKGRGLYEHGKLVSWTLKKLYKNEYLPYRTMRLENDKVAWKNYHDNGELYSKVSYGEYNTEDGNWKFYYPNGKVKHDITFLAKDCYDKIYEIEETVIESVDDYNEANGTPGLPSGYLPEALTKQENFDFYYECEASAQGDYTHFYKNGKPKLKAAFKDGQLTKDLLYFNKSNKKSTFDLNDDLANFDELIQITPIKIESNENIDNSSIEPEPFEIIIYYENSYYSGSEIKKVIVHPIFKAYILKLKTDSPFFSKLLVELNKNEAANFGYKNFSRRLYYKLESYKKYSYED